MRKRPWKGMFQKQHQKQQTKENRIVFDPIGQLKHKKWEFYLPFRMQLVSRDLTAHNAQAENTEPKTTPVLSPLQKHTEVINHNDEDRTHCPNIHKQLLLMLLSQLAVDAKVYRPSQSTTAVMVVRNLHNNINIAALLECEMPKLLLFVGYRWSAIHTNYTTVDNPADVF